MTEAPVNGLLSYFDGTNKKPIGWYWQFTDRHGNPTTEMAGPYDTAEQAKQFAQWAFEQGHW